MKYDDLLFEVGTEELPPGCLTTMTSSLVQNFKSGLKEKELSFDDIVEINSPRRMGFIVKKLQYQQYDKTIEHLGPPATSAYDEVDGTPTQAAKGFARAYGVSVDDLTTKEGKKNVRLAYRYHQKGKTIENIIPGLINDALKFMKINKTMRWGEGNYEFVRPVKWVILIYGNQVITMHLYGHQSNNLTYGHRVYTHDPIMISKPCNYHQVLEKTGYVIVDHQKRKQIIKEQAEEYARRFLSNINLDNNLLNEVAALTEWPKALCCEFDKAYLRVPQEALISAMKKHQKAFPVMNHAGHLINRFIAVSDIESETEVIKGNEKVMNARLEDAAFFYDQDLKSSLEKWQEKLKQVSFHSDLGSLFNRSQRISYIAQQIAKSVNADTDVASRSGILTKVDLVSDMVQEFPELQGIMGYYYALAHNERKAVASAIKTQYTPSFAGDILPESLTACSVALADKLDLLTGIYGIGLKPTGDKDPFALRRAAIGIVRILREKSLALPLDQLISWSLHAYRYYAEVELSTSLNQELITFIFDRLRYLLKNEGINYETFQSVRAVSPSTIPDFMARIKAVSAFSKSQSCYDLAMANKRVSNILQKNNITEKLSIDHSLLKEKSESELMQEIEKCEYEIKDLLKSGEYFKVLSRLTKLKQPVNQFFDHVVIMDNSESIKLNRLGLIQRLHLLFKQVAAIGELSV